MQEEVVELKNKVNFITQENEYLKHVVKLFKEEKFGTKSEQYIEEENPQLLFILLALCSNFDQQECSIKTMV